MPLIYINAHTCFQDTVQIKLTAVFRAVYTRFDKTKDKSAEAKSNIVQ